MIRFINRTYFFFNYILKNKLQIINLNFKKQKIKSFIILNFLSNILKNNKNIKIFKLNYIKFIFYKQFSNTFLKQNTIFNNHFESRIILKIILLFKIFHNYSFINILNNKYNYNILNIKNLIYNLRYNNIINLSSFNYYFNFFFDEIFFKLFLLVNYKNILLKFDVLLNNINKDVNINVEPLNKIVNNDISSRYIIKKFINLIVKKGKKSKAYKIMLEVFFKLKLITGLSPLFLILTGIKSLKPYADITKIRKAGKIYEVPVPFKKKKQLFIIIKWILKGITNKKNNIFLNFLISDLINIYFKKGQSFRFREDLNKKIYKNRAITHFRWF